MEDVSKGYDPSLPRNGIIFGVAVFTIVLLVVIKFALDSYFGTTMDQAYHEKVAIRGLEAIEEMRATEQKVVGKGAAPMVRAVEMLEKRGRRASNAITPKSGDGMPEVAGWSQLKREVAPAGTAEAAPAEPVAPTQGAEH